MLEMDPRTESAGIFEKRWRGKIRTPHMQRKAKYKYTHTHPSRINSLTNMKMHAISTLNTSAFSFFLCFIRMEPLYSRREKKRNRKIKTINHYHYKNQHKFSTLLPVKILTNWSILKNEEEKKGVIVIPCTTYHAYRYMNST